MAAFTAGDDLGTDRGRSEAARVRGGGHRAVLQRRLPSIWGREGVRRRPQIMCTKVAT